MSSIGERVPYQNQRAMMRAGTKIAGLRLNCGLVRIAIAQPDRVVAG